MFNWVVKISIMAKAKCDIRIGTSGWYYYHWVGRFYPSDLPKSKWFEFYAKEFNTVEINNTFYHLPKQKSVQRWYKVAPKNFVYAVKANRFITHIKRLKDISEPLERFFEIIGLFKEKLGPVLYQLPPSLHKDLDLLKSFILLLPKRSLSVFEFRHKSWYDEGTFELLNENGAGFCIHDLGGLETPRVITGDVIYIRFHGTTGRYAGNYTMRALRNWSNWIKDNKSSVRAVYAYFNNDYNAYAVQNAKELKKYLSGDDV
jgi:uncharacterized protein YecE (DUF72 family)